MARPSRGGVENSAAAGASCANRASPGPAAGRCSGLEWSAASLGSGARSARVGPAGVLRQVIVRTDRRCQLGRAGHWRFGAAFQAAKRSAYRLYARGEDILRVDDDPDADALQFRVPGHEVLAGRRGDRERRLAVASGDAGAHLILRLRRIQEEDVCPFRDEGLDPGPCLVKAARNPGIGPRQQENAFVTTGRCRRLASQDRGVALNHQLGPAMAERARPDLVFYQYRRSTAAGISADYLLHRESIAVPSIAIGQPQNVWGGRDTSLDGIRHFAKADQIHVRHRQPHCRNARSGNKAGAKAGFLDQTGAHAVAATWHDLQPGLVQERFQRSSLRTHWVSFLWIE